jgi:hypothetical protein
MRAGCLRYSGVISTANDVSTGVSIMASAAFSTPESFFRFTRANAALAGTAREPRSLVCYRPT